MRKRFVSACSSVNKFSRAATNKVTGAVRNLATHVRDFFVRPSIDQLISADFATHAGLFGLGVFYALGLLLTGHVLAGLAFSAFAGYYLWLMIKLSPWYTRLVVLARTETDLLDAVLNGDNEKVMDFVTSSAA